MIWKSSKLTISNKFSMQSIKNSETQINPAFEDSKHNFKQEETSDSKKENQAINGMWAVLILLNQDSKLKIFQSSISEESI